MLYELFIIKNTKTKEWVELEHRTAIMPPKKLGARKLILPPDCIISDWEVLIVAGGGIVPSYPFKENGLSSENKRKLYDLEKPVQEQLQKITEVVVPAWRSYRDIFKF